MKKTSQDWLPYIALLLLLGGCGGSDSTPVATDDPAPAVVTGNVDAATEPPPAPPSLPPPDADTDGISDAQDNCPHHANATQDDVDADGVGDVCDAVNDDTLDTDGDGVIDKKDAFPKDPKEWLDTDNDTVGDNTDNCPVIANTDQANTDQVLKKAGVVVTGTQQVVADGLGDVCDTDPDGDGRSVVYVDGKNGDDKNTGYLKSPVRNLMQGMKLADERKAGVWVAAGDYDVGNVTWLKGAQLFGGYDDNFDPATRDVSPAAKNPTRLLAEGKTTVLLLQNLSTDTRFDGFKIEATPVTTNWGATVAIDNSVVSLVDCVVVGNPLSTDDAAVRVTHNGFATIIGGQLLARSSSQGVDSTGLWASSATVTVDGALVFGGDAPHATALRLIDASAEVTKTVVNAMSDLQLQEMAIAVWAESSVIKLRKNTVLASGVQAEGIYFEKGLAPSEGTVIQNNSVYVGPQPTASPYLRDWNGTAYTVIEDGDFQATFLNGKKQKFADVVGAGSTGGNVVGDGK